MVGSASGTSGRFSMDGMSMVYLIAWQKHPPCSVVCSCGRKAIFLDTAEAVGLCFYLRYPRRRCSPAGSSRTQISRQQRSEELAHKKKRRGELYYTRRSWCDNSANYDSNIANTVVQLATSNVARPGQGPSGCGGTVPHCFRGAGSLTNLTP